jgi:lipopolysaccharide transport system ATP-binding protein
MSELAIRVENVSKRYRIGVRDTHRTLREALVNATKRPFQRVQALLCASNGRQPEETFWALRDVSFEVKQGEVLGIIGRNGAGKSTLLKLLSRITEPTEGRIEGYGRVGSLLEVGTGFHPELTGRENIYLNGAILGMTRAEIQRKFDEIVAFAEIDQFLDTPVKRYSSGMRMRLAFAVAAHLDPEILIVDEVLAVGDASFQRKCMGKMSIVAGEGRTVLFVSHNMGAIQTLCNRVIMLRQGTLYTDGCPASVISTYLALLETAVVQDLAFRNDRRGRGRIRLTRIDISIDGDTRSAALATGRPACFVFHLTAVAPRLTCSFTIYDKSGQQVTFFDSAVRSVYDREDWEDGAKLSCLIDELPFLPGRYRLNAAIMSNGELEDHIEGAAFFEVQQGSVQGRIVPEQTGTCSVFLQHRWTTPRER